MIEIVFKSMPVDRIEICKSVIKSNKIRDSPIKTLLNAASTLVDSKAEVSRNKSLWFSTEIKAIGDSIDFNCCILDHFCSHTIQTGIYDKWTGPVTTEKTWEQKSDFKSEILNSYNCLADITLTAAWLFSNNTQRYFICYTLLPFQHHVTWNKILLQTLLLLLP